MFLLPSLLLILACLSGSFGEEDLQKKVFVFPAASKKAVVRVNVSLEHPLTNFTMCLRFNSLQFRPYTLFHYFTKRKSQDFQITKPNPREFNLKIGGITQIIVARQISYSEWQHLCVSWNSTSGLVSFWLNGYLYPRFVMKKGYKMSQNGTMFLGHDRDSWGKDDSFLGEMADFNLWPRVLKPDEINSVKKNVEVPDSLVRWEALSFKVWGGIRTEEALYQGS